jgi:hypothetical protein
MCSSCMEWGWLSYPGHHEQMMHEQYKRSINSIKFNSSSSIKFEASCLLSVPTSNIWILLHSAIFSHKLKLQLQYLLPETLSDLPLPPVAVPSAWSLILELGFSLSHATLVFLHFHPWSPSCIKCAPDGNEDTQHHTPVAYHNSCTATHTTLCRVFYSSYTTLQNQNTHQHLKT